jgi:hypothetical protein
MEKKTFFKTPTIGQIKKNKTICEITNNLIENILSLKKNQTAILNVNLIPKQYRNSKHFLKHGPEVKVREYSSLKDALTKRITPVKLREEAFNKIKNPILSGYSYKPIIGNDKRTRKIQLVDCINGAKIFGYTYQDILGCPSIDFEKNYKDATGVQKDGSNIIAWVPSTSKNQPRYKIKLSSVTVEDTQRKWGLAYNLFSNHSCDEKTYNIRYKHKDQNELSNVEKFCQHDIAMYHAILDNYVNEKKNWIPLEQSIIAIPTQFTVDFYNKLNNQCLIKEKNKQPKKLNKAHKEILLWGLIYKMQEKYQKEIALGNKAINGHDKTFFATDKLRNYKWK